MIGLEMMQVWVMRGAVLVMALMAVGAGCSTQTTIHTEANDTYAVSGRFTSSVSGLLIAQNTALDEAQAFCHGKGMRFHQLQDQVQAGDATYTVRFRCLAATDPLVQRPTVNQAPDQMF
jgi:hypothetical protein